MHTMTDHTHLYPYPTHTHKHRQTDRQTDRHTHTSTKLISMLKYTYFDVIKPLTGNLEVERSKEWMIECYAVIKETKKTKLTSKSW